MLKLDLEAVVEDAGDEVFQFEIQISLIYWKFVGLYIIKISSYYHSIGIPLKEGLSVMVQPCFPSSVCLCLPPSMSTHLCQCLPALRNYSEAYLQCTHTTTLHLPSD